MSTAKKNPVPTPLAAGDDAAVAGLGLAQQAMGIITWLWDLRLGQVHWTGDLSPLLGLPAGGYAGDFPDYLRRLHADHRDLARRRLAALLKGDVSGFQAEECVCWSDGSLHWLEVFGRASLGADGRPQQLAGVIHDVTERRRTQDALARNEARLRRLIDDAPVAIGTSRGARVQSGNPAFRRLFGFPAEGEIDSTVASLIAPRALPPFIDRGEARARGEPVASVYEIPMLRQDGSEFIGLVSISGATLSDSADMVVFIQDLTESARQREAVRRERDRAMQYLQVAQAILVAADTDGRITMLNRRGHELLDWPDGSLIGDDWFERVRPASEAGPARAAYQALTRGQRELPEYHESEVCTRLGTRRMIAWRMVLLRDDAGTITGVLASGEDITERRAAERTLQALNTDLERRVAARTAELAAARDAAEAGTRAKGEFLAHMSHEIRTPMNAIIGMTHAALASGDLGPRPREQLQHIRRAADTLLRIINQILDWSKIEAHGLALSEERFDLHEVVDALLAMVAPSAAEKGLALAVDLDPHLPQHLVGDPLRLGQVLLNLCSNAVKFTERGEVRLALRAGPVAPDKVQVRFEVRDTGIGIAADAIARLGQPFDQLDPSITRRHGGTGLGLAISRRLVVQMGGEITVDSQPGVGSRFSFALDFAPTDPAAPDPAPLHTGGHHRLRGRRLLLVDDNELNRMVASDLLGGMAGATVGLAVDGQEALDRLRREPFDLVLMDLQMPGLDGYETTRRLRADPALAGLPVIAMTAHALARDRERCLAVGMNDFVTKPIEPRELLAVLDRWLTATPAVDSDGPPLSPALGLARCLSRPDLYGRVLDRFVESRRDDGEVLLDALARHDRQRLGAVAHLLIASAGTIGAEPLASSARALQDALDGGQAAAWPPLVRRMAHQHEALMRSIAELRPTLAP